MAIPKEIRTLKQWTYSFSEDEPKRPKYTRYQPNGALDYDSAIEVTPMYVGLYVTEQDPYFLMDLDHIQVPEEFELEVPEKLQQFLIRNRTYCETSPSGKGVRLIYKLPSVKDKELVNGYIFYSTEIENHREAQINFGPPWQTITGNELPQSTGTVKEVTLDDLKECFKIKFKVTDLNKQNKTTFKGDAPKAKDLLAALYAIPLDKNPRVRRAYERLTGQNYSHYDLWLKVLMALHHYCKVTGNDVIGMEHAVKWSSKDPEDYDGPESVIKKWQSFDEEGKDESITYLTIFKLAQYCTLRWPYCTEKGKPIHSQIENLRALFKFYDIELYQDENAPSKYYLRGDNDIIDKWFKVPNVTHYFGEYYGPFTVDNFPPILTIFMQSFGYVGIRLDLVKMLTKLTFATTKKKINFFKRYIDSPFRELPQEMRDNEENYSTSNFEELWSCIEVDKSASAEQKALYRRIFKAWFLGLLRPLYYHGEFAGNSGMLLLTGPEQTYKTSFFRFLLPKFFRDEVQVTTHGFSSPNELRDLSKIAAMCRILVIDEVDQHFKDEVSESGFKKLLDNLPQTVIDKYAITPTTIKPYAIYGATSNKDQFKLSSLGMRRLFRIPVHMVNTDKLLTLCWHPILRELKKELRKGGTPWLLTETELSQLASVNYELRSPTNLDLVMDEIWDFESEFDYLTGVTNFTSESSRLMKLQEVMEYLEMHTGMYRKISMTALKNALTRKCSVYTGTTRNELEVAHPRCIIRKGKAHQGRVSKWVMPPFKHET